MMINTPHRGDERETGMIEVDEIKEEGEDQMKLPYGFSSPEEMIQSAEAEQIFWDDKMTGDGAAFTSRSFYLEYLRDLMNIDAEAAVRELEIIEDSGRTLLIELLKLDKYREIPMSDLVFRAYAVAVVWYRG